MRILGIDVGKQRDPSALVCVEGKKDKPERLVTGGHRLDLNMSYLGQARVMLDAAKGMDMVVIDANGVGQAVIDYVLAADDAPDNVWALVTTGGDKARIVKDRRMAYIPKKSLVTHLQAILEKDCLRLRPAAHVVLDELRDFERKTGGKLEAKAGAHDDVLMALCLALMGFKIGELVR